MPLVEHTPLVERYEPPRRLTNDAPKASWDGFVESTPDDMYLVAPAPPEDIAAGNAKAFEFLAQPLPPPAPGQKAGLTYREAFTIHRWLRHHPIVRGQGKYDPTGEYGFCFGKAAAAHLKAAHLGVAESHMFKLIGVGPLRTESGQPGDHHMATAVKAIEHKGVWVIEDSADRPLTARAWYDRFLGTWGHGAKEAIRLWVTPAKRFGPRDRMSYALSAPPSGYNGYFEDLFPMLREEFEHARLKLSDGY